MTLDAIRRLRPNWLRSRAAPTPAGFRQGGVEPALRVDGSFRESLQELETLPGREVLEISFLSAADATTLYGTGYTEGVIRVRTRGGSRVWWPRAPDQGDTEGSSSASH